MRCTFALTIMALSVALLDGCSKKSPDELTQIADQTYATALKTADSIRAFTPNIKQHFQPSLDAYEKIVTDCSGTSQAEKALIKIASIRQNDIREPDQAIAAYQRYLSTYPDGQMAPLSMFMVGYLYNNEIHNNDSAKASYQRFLDKYPQSENAPAAQFELQNIGKPLEDVLPPVPEEEEQTATTPPASKGKHSGSKHM